MAEIPLAPGVLLVAPPALDEPNFRRSVVLLCEHTSEGSFGLVLNRPLDAEPSDVLEGFDGYSGQLLLGGPVQTDTLHYLHSGLSAIEDAIEVGAGVSWGGSFDRVQELVGSYEASTSNLRFFLGYSGWGEGQLENEIELGGWIVAESSPGDVFATDPAALWRSVLRRMGGDYAILSNFPEDPRMN